MTITSQEEERERGGKGEREKRKKRKKKKKKKKRCMVGEHFVDFPSRGGEFVWGCQRNQYEFFY